MIIGVDIDGVLYPWTDAANAALVERFGIPVLGDHLHWDWLKGQITREQWSWLWSTEGQDASFGHVNLIYPGVLEAFNAILKNPRNKVHFVTHRDPRRTALHTAAFLTHHFGRFPWAGVHVLQNGTPKHALAAWDVFVDDKPDTVLSMLVRTRAQVFAPARTWNEELSLRAQRAGKTSRLVRYSDPMEVADWIGAQ